MKILELFSGTESFGKVARERGHEVFSVDFDKEFNPSLCKDIMELTSQEILDKFGQPDVIWASPPCQCFSIASVYRHWKDGKPKDEKTLVAIEIVKKTLQLIKELNPKFYIIENPRGMLRRQDFMQHLHRDTVTYCKYGLEWQKATDLWNNLNWKPRELCKANAPCHVRAPRGSNAGIQGTNGYRANREQKHPIDASMLRIRPGDHPDSRYNISRSPVLRAVVPKELCLEIIKHIELYPQNNTQEQPKPLESTHNSSYIDEKEN